MVGVPCSNTTEDRTMKKTTVRDKILATIDLVASLFVEREDQTRKLMIAALRRGGGCGILLGPPGVAKSAVLNALCTSVTGGGYYEILLNPATDPADLFGHPDGDEAINGRFVVDKENAIQCSNFAMVDEVYKGGEGPVQNSLLTLMADRRVRYGGSYWESPDLFLIVGASNEWPSDPAQLDAFDDRWDVRLWVEDIQEEDNFTAMLMANPDKSILDGVLTMDDMREARDQASQVKVPREIAVLLRDCRRTLADEKGIKCSPRKWKRFTGLLQVNAWLEGRDEVIPEDVAYLCGDTLWRDPGDRQPIMSVMGRLADPVGAKAQQMLDAASAGYIPVRDQDHSSDPDSWIQNAAKCNRRLKDQVGKLVDLQKAHPNSPKVKEALGTIKGYHKELSRRLVDVAGAV